MVEHRLVSLAAGTVLDVSPARAVEVAAEAGFPGVGLWFDPETWDDSVTREVRRRLDDTGLIALDIEPVILGRGDDPGERMIAAADALDVAFLLVASGPATEVEVAERLSALCELARDEAPELTIVLEFLPIFTVSSLDVAQRIVESVGAPNLAILVDTLHLVRSGATAADLAAVDHRLLPYLQVADAPAVGPIDRVDLREEALNGRLLPGDGELPIREIVAAVPDVPISIELRSAALMAAYPDPIDRARLVRRATSAMLGE